MNELVELKMGVYRHFKGKEYEVFDLAEHTETGESLVIYRSINRERYCDNGIVYARPFYMFISEVDKDKYPEIKQKYRFQYLYNMEEKINDSKIMP